MVYILFDDGLAESFEWVHARCKTINRKTAGLGSKKLKKHDGYVPGTGRLLCVTHGGLGDCSGGI